MAEKSGSDQSKAQLRQQISQSRALVARDIGGLRYELNFPLKFKKAFQRNTVVWVGAALALGFHHREPREVVGDFLQVRPGDLRG